MRRFYDFRLHSSIVGSSTECTVDSLPHFTAVPPYSFLLLYSKGRSTPAHSEVVERENTGIVVVPINC